MDTYSLLRQIADSWMLLGMFGFFAGAAIWAFLPSQSSARAAVPSLRSPRKDTPMAEKKTDEETGGETTGHSWDGIEELNNPLPRWWL